MKCVDGKGHNGAIGKNSGQQILPNWHQFYLNEVAYFSATRTILSRWWTRWTIFCRVGQDLVDFTHASCTLLMIPMRSAKRVF
jgi:hypothetical protein